MWGWGGVLVVVSVQLGVLQGEYGGDAKEGDGEVGVGDDEP